MAKTEVIVAGVKFAVGDHVRRKIGERVPESTGEITSISMEEISGTGRNKYIYFRMEVRWKNYSSIFNVEVGGDLALVQASSFVTGNNPNSTFRKRSNNHDGKGKG